MKHLKSFAFGLLAVLVLASVWPSHCTAGFFAGHEKHRVIKAIPNSPEFGVIKHQASTFISVADLPVKIADVPKAKVYCRKTYFGMTVGSDISHRYSSANIRYPGKAFNWYDGRPPLISFS